MADFPVLSMSDWELLAPVNLSQKGPFLRASPLLYIG
jgi:hypothetical protein